MSKTDVATTEAAGLPAPYQPTMSFDSSDVQLPRIRIAHSSTPYVVDNLVPNGALYAASGQDDPDPVLLTDAGEDADGIIVYVLGLKKGKSLSDGDGELQRWDFDDPDAPAEARVTYDYWLAVPDHDEMVPYRMLFKSTGTPAAKQMNTVLAKEAGRQPQHHVAFQIKTKPRQKDKYRWHSPVVRRVEATEAGKQVADELLALVGNRPDLDAVPARSDAPAI